MHLFGEPRSVPRDVMLVTPSDPYCVDIELKRDSTLLPVTVPTEDRYAESGDGRVSGAAADR